MYPWLSIVKEEKCLKEVSHICFLNALTYQISLIDFISNDRKKRKGKEAAYTKTMCTYFEPTDNTRNMEKIIK